MNALLDERAVRKRHSFFEFSLCLSRACLGKTIIFSIKWRQNGVSLPALGAAVEDDKERVAAGVLVVLR